MNFRSVVFLSLSSLLVACGQTEPVRSCLRDLDCGSGYLCEDNLCVVPKPHDAGSGDAGPGDAGNGDPLSPADAGLDAGPSCVPATEVCNGVDDDCDGQIDEQVEFVGSDGGIALDGGTGSRDGSCVVGIGACQRTGSIACVSGQLICSVPAGMAVVEVCNGVDDDCDGQVDEAGADLCPATGQTCGAGACSCPSGQSVCGTTCVSLGSSCSAGVGACARSGSNLCSSGAVTCSATPGTPSSEICNGFDDDCDGQTDEAGAGLCSVQGAVCTSGMCQCPAGQSACNGVCKVLTAEVCDGVDNDCNGQVDEGVTIACLGDTDRDGFADSANVAQVCPASGACPSGYVSPSAALDCAPMDSSKWRLVLARVDADADQSCTGSAQSLCVGSGAPTGYRLATECRSEDDCNESDGNRFRMLLGRLDSDQDNFCANAAPIYVCSGSAVAAPYRAASDCAPTVDCDDNNRLAWALISVRADMDGDSWCAAATISQCTNGTPNAGYRIATSCAGTDCLDTNRNATNVCSTSVTSNNTKSCGVGIDASETLSFPWNCGVGFHSVRAVLAQTGNDVADIPQFSFIPGFSQGNQTVRAVCKFAAVGTENISLVVSCEAD